MLEAVDEDMADENYKLLVRPSRRLARSLMLDKHAFGPQFTVM